MIAKNIKFANFCIVFLYCIMATVATLHHHHRHQHYQNDAEELKELRRSGRFECTEKAEDIQHRKSHWEQWELHCRCSNISAPACGSDGVTYQNRCHLECTARNQYQRFRSNEGLRLITLSPCPDDESLFNRTVTDPPLFPEQLENRS